MTGKFKLGLLRFVNDLLVAFLIPLILLVWISELFDDRLWKYWDMKSLDNWRWFRWHWYAYAIAFAGRVIAGTGIYFLAQWWRR
jgi:hypothetical protein